MFDISAFDLWFLIVGALFIVIALGRSVLRPLPLTTSMFYLLVGIVLGPYVLGLLRLDPIVQAEILERLTEVAVVISLFTAGLKLRTPFTNSRWQLPVRLAFGSMTITVILVTLVGVYLLGLPLGAAVLLGGILAPTDPVLASDVQVERPGDEDRVRFSLTGEAGLNDGTAFPFVMLGLGLLGLHEIGEFGWQWLLVDVIWATGAGLAIGGIAGTLIGRLVIYMRREHKEAVGLDDFLGLGLIALSYGTALLFHSYGFLAVFAAGLALRRIERQHSGDKPPEEVLAVGREVDDEEIATDPDRAPAYMTQAVLGFNEQIERIGEVGVVVILGAMLALDNLPLEAIWFAPLLFLVIRPFSVLIGMVGLLNKEVGPVQRRLVGWFGIRGIGSIYYLAYAIAHGLPPDLAERITGLALAVVAISILVHGISVTPLMSFYGRLRERTPGEAPT